jgi:phosphoribosylglycinamide formyltransferase 1
MIPIVVLASGRGSNFDSIRQAIEKKELHAEIAAVISDQPEAPVLQKAAAYGIEPVLIPFPFRESGKTREDQRKEHEELLLKKLTKIKPHFLVMAGYMRVVTPQLIETFRSDREYSRIVNIHPSLLPAFPGMNAYAQAFQYGVQMTGVTVHLVEAQVDSGPICAQEAFSITDCRSEEEVQQKGLMIEHRLFPKTLQWVLSEKFELERRSEGRLYVRSN